MLGHTAGQNMWIGMLGFALTGILLPFITVIVVAFYDEGVESVGNRIHPWFGFIFCCRDLHVYRSILRYSTCCKCRVRNWYKTHFTCAQPMDFNYIRSNLFFAIVYWISLNPSKIVDNLGKLLTPLLLLMVALLSIAVIFNPESALVHLRINI